MESAHTIAERVARDSYGRLLAIIAARSGDIASAEDALATAFRAALEHWPNKGVPDRPEAWLVTVARREISRDRRHEHVIDAATSELLLRLDERLAATSEGLPDRRLELMLACGRPEIDRQARTALMLQAVLGLDAKRIANAFLVSPAAMSQRLVRAKKSLRSLDRGFELPEADVLPARLDSVLAAIYAAFGAAWDDAHGGESQTSGLSGEAIWLGKLIVELLPDEPEAKGLLALMLYCEARRPARRDKDGRFVPLREQDWRTWQRDLVEHAELLLRDAAALGRPGRYQTEAAIQSLHVTARQTGQMPFAALTALYDVMAAHWPSTGVLVSRAAAYGEAGAIGVALVQLDGLRSGDIESYQPYWVTRAHLLSKAGRTDASAAALTRAIGLTSDPGLRSFLQDQAASR